MSDANLEIVEISVSTWKVDGKGDYTAEFRNSAGDVLESRDGDCRNLDEDMEDWQEEFPHAKIDVGGGARQSSEKDTRFM